MGKRCGVGRRHLSPKLVQRRDGGFLAGIFSVNDLPGSNKKKIVLALEKILTWSWIQFMSKNLQNLDGVGWSLIHENFPRWCKTDYLYGGLWRECCPVDSRSEKRFWCPSHLHTIQSKDDNQYYMYLEHAATFKVAHAPFLSLPSLSRSWYTGSCAVFIMEEW